MAISQVSEVPDPVKNADGTDQFWIKDAAGKELLRPVWGSKLGPNADSGRGWTAEFVRECQDKTHMRHHQVFLSTVSPTYMIDTMESAIFQSLTNTWKLKTKGELELRTAQKQIAAQEYNRSEAVSGILLLTY